MSADGFAPTIAYTYRNEPDLALRGVRSEIHYGAAVLRVNGKPANELDGRYWTDRPTRGTFRFGEHTVRIAQSYAEATNLSYGPPKPAGVLTYLRS
jgi:hypothetical protein